MLPDRCQRLLRGLLLICLGAVSGIGQGLELTADARHIVELRSRVAVYEYFQGDHVAALTELMVAAQQGVTAVPVVDSLPIEASAYLAYGMDRHASAALHSVVRDRTLRRAHNEAWFLMGQMAYQRGQWIEARDHFARIAGSLPAERQSELRALQLNLALRTESARTSQLDIGVDPGIEVDSGDAWGPYRLYNLGAYHLKQGRTSSGRDLLDRALAMPAETDEQRDLRDRSLVTVAYGMMRQGDHAAAERYFEQVRVDSAMGPRALLGYGWARALADAHSEALYAWQWVAAGALHEPPVQEALLAVPWAYEQLGGAADAQLAYQQADRRLGQEYQRIRQFTSTLSQQGLVKALDSREGDTAPWFQLVEVLSSEQFQQYRRSLLELREMRNDLYSAKRDLLGFRELLARRQPLGHDALARSLERTGALRDRYQQLQAAVIRAGDSNYMALAGEGGAALWSHVLSAQQYIESLQHQGLPMGDAQERLRRFRGMLIWQVTDDTGDWRERIDLVMEDLQRELAAAERTTGNLQQRIGVAPDGRPFELQLRQLDGRLRQQWAELERQERDLERALRSDAEAVLNRQAARMKRYQAKARLALARLADEAML